MKNDIVRLLKQDSSSDARFTSMIDLYGLPSSFPGTSDAMELRGNPHARVALLESRWAEDIGDQRFIPYIQLHEYEAYVLSDVQRLSTFYENASNAIRRLQQLVASVDTPELIDDGAQTSPSRRIVDEFPDYAARKTTVGTQAARLIGVSGIRSKCPHFDGWLTRLEQLASG